MDQVRERGPTETAFHPWKRELGVKVSGRTLAARNPIHPLPVVNGLISTTCQCLTRANRTARHTSRDSDSRKPPFAIVREHVTRGGGRGQLPDHLPREV